jgi:hypothetical protein
MCFCGGCFEDPELKLYVWREEDQQEIYAKECKRMRLSQFEFKQRHPEERFKFIVKHKQREDKFDFFLLVVMRSTKTTAVQAFVNVDLHI